MSLAKVGQPAPAFSAPVFDPRDHSRLGRAVSLSDYRGKWLVFFWYPLDFTEVCPTEITALSDRYQEFQDSDCELLGASTDSVYSHKAWAATPRGVTNGVEGLRYPLLSDMTHQIAREYGVLVEDQGFALRGLFIVDPEGVIQYATINNVNIGRSVDETLRVLRALQTGGMCPCDWKPGRKTLEG